MSMIYYFFIWNLQNGSSKANMELWSSKTNDLIKKKKTYLNPMISQIPSFKIKLNLDNNPK